METTMFMRIDGGRIRGSSTAASPYDRWSTIDVLEMGVGHVADDNIGGTSERALAKSCIVWKRPDLSSCDLLRLTALQQSFRLEIHTCTSTGEGRGTAPRLEPYVTYELGACVVASYGVHTKGEQGELHERIVFDFSRLSTSHAEIGRDNRVVPGGRSALRTVHEFESAG